MYPVVFLDMDDVLCVSREYNSVQVIMCFRENKLDWPELWAELVDTEARRNLRKLHDEFEPQYVISSSWATYLDHGQMCEVFERTHLHFVLQCLHQAWKTPRGRGMSRMEEITAWLEESHLSGQPYLILDDTESGWSLLQAHDVLQGRTVFCDSAIGFSHEKLELARKILRQD